MGKVLCDICGKASSCFAAGNVTKRKILDNFDSIATNFCNNNRNLFQNQSFGAKPLRSVDTLAYNDKKTEISLIEIKKASALAITGFLVSIKEKYIDSLFILAHLKPGTLVKRWTIAIPGNDYLQLLRVRSSLGAYFSSTGNIDNAYYFRVRGHLFSATGLKKTFCYPASLPRLKRCQDAV